EYERWQLVSYEANRPLEIEPEFDDNGVERPGYKRDRRRQRLSRFFFEDRIEPVTPAELEAAQQQIESDVAELEGQALEEISN
ncbi:MAG TPA: ubiquinol-cytochrome c reductase cytochrome b subunit, partial [Beutenbergiaceae bacterium]|nr:ubiquinol-cytochrome c reductase cytochrome b subunit [Beutenbergiaceae bacterium]